MTNREAMVEMPMEDQVLYIKNHLYGFCYYCPHEISSRTNPCDFGWCEEGITNWLDAEVGDDERRWLSEFFEVNDNGRQT